MNKATALGLGDEDWRALLEQVLARAGDRLDEHEALDPRHRDAALLQPALDMLRRPGKGFRTEFFESCWALAGGPQDGQPPELPLLVDLLHVGSLIIDDIEDDSETRRGDATLHRRFGVPVALNTGNWLYCLPLVLLARVDLRVELKLALYEEIAEALVLCHEGQALDLSARVATVRQAEMPALVARSSRLKTGSLMRLAAVLAARAAGGRGDVVDALGRFGAALGVGLQMLDDWSGIAAEARRHKGIEDIRLGRPTWPWAWLSQRCDEVTYAARVHELRAVRGEWAAERLLLRVRDHIHREAPVKIALHLQQSLSELESTLGPSAALEALRWKVADLETAYG